MIRDEACERDLAVRMIAHLGSHLTDEERGDLLALQRQTEFDVVILRAVTIAEHLGLEVPDEAATYVEDYLRILRD